MKNGVAVIVPAHNSAAFLETALRSVREQTEKPSEVVVVDDGSTDGSHEIAGRMGVTCIRQECRGPGAARNRGIQATSAPLVAFLDADDWFAPEKLETQIALLETVDVPACCSDATIVRDGVDRAGKNRGKNVPSMLNLDHLMVSNPVICSTVLVRREALQAAGGFDEDPVLVSTEDYDLWLRLVGQGPIAYQDLPLSYYLLHSHNLSDNLRFLVGIDRIMEKVEQRAPGDPQVKLMSDRRRAGVRLDAAYDLVKSGEASRARGLLREARRLSGWSWKGFKIQLRGLIGG